MHHWSLILSILDPKPKESCSLLKNPNKKKVIKQVVKNLTNKDQDNTFKIIGSISFFLAGQIAETIYVKARF